MFCGDVGVPFDTDIDTSDIEPIFHDCSSVVNFEGALLFSPEERSQNRWDDKYSLYNTTGSVGILRRVNAKVLSLLNNHTRDFRFDITRTRFWLEKEGFRVMGTSNPDETRLTLADGREFIFITFATYGCVHNFNLLNPGALVRRVRRLREENPDASIAIFPHWGLELRRLPEPADRHLAHRLIDAGADIIVGHHPHVVQPVEIYNDRYIVYSIGNFMMPNSQVGDKKYEPRPATHTLMTVQWDGRGTAPIFHGMHFDPDLNILTTLPEFKPEFIDSATPAKDYLKAYIRSAGASHYLRFARYTDSALGERLRWLRMRAYYLLRRSLIKLGIYCPY